MIVLVQQHGRFTSLLTQIPECSRKPRSFASKYLHFRHPEWTTSKAPFKSTVGGDSDYGAYCARFYELYELCQQHGRSVTVKSLDTYLWAVPG